MSKTTVRKDTVVVILTHGRPDNVITYNALRDGGYTGRILLMVDDEDETVEGYQEKFGKDDVIVFDKEKASEMTDHGGLVKDKKGVVFARNALNDFMVKMNYNYYLVLDDDLNRFSYTKKPDGTYKNALIKGMDNTVNAMVEFHEETKVDIFSMALSAQFFGGENSSIFRDGFARKVRNSFLISTDRPIHYASKVNEDVILSALQGQQGKLFLTTGLVRLDHQMDANTTGGMTDTHDNLSSYARAFYEVMYTPSSGKMFQGKHNGGFSIHTKSKNTYPNILRENLKK